MIRRLKSYSNAKNESAWSQCLQLWHRILIAPGYHRDFRTWTLDTLTMWVPHLMPSVEYLQELYLQVQMHVQQEIQQFRVKQQRRIKEKMHADILKGGSAAFKRVRDAANPPLAYIGILKQVQFTPQRWKKEALVCIRYTGTCDFQVGMPVLFQEQTAHVVDIQPDVIHFSQPLRCKKFKNLTAYQRDATATQSEVQTAVADAWQTFWARDPSPPWCDDWTNACEWVTALSDCESCPYEDFTHDKWMKNLAKANKKSARGACGFSVKELLLMPCLLQFWLFQLFHLAEDFGEWPDKFGVARVVFLTKPDGQPNDAMGLRPITILSTIYRQWSSFRSQEVFAQLPPQIGNIASHISSDMLAALVCGHVGILSTHQNQIMWVGAGFEEMF